MTTHKLTTNSNSNAATCRDCHRTAFTRPGMSAYEAITHLVCKG